MFWIINYRETVIAPSKLNSRGARINLLASRFRRAALRIIARARMRARRVAAARLKDDPWSALRLECRSRRFVSRFSIGERQSARSRKLGRMVSPACPGGHGRFYERARWQKYRQLVSSVQLTRSVGPPLLSAPCTGDSRMLCHCLEIQ